MGPVLSIFFEKVPQVKEERVLLQTAVLFPFWIKLAFLVSFKLKSSGPIALRLLSWEMDMAN